jgi:hypothetical protein
VSGADAGGSGRRRTLLALGLLLVPALLLGTFVLGLGSPDTDGVPGATYGVDYDGETLVVTQETGRVRSGTLFVRYATPNATDREVWVAPNGTGYDNGGSGHPVSPGDQFVFAADVDGSVEVVWVAPDGEDRAVLEETRVEGPPEALAADSLSRPAGARA